MGSPVRSCPGPIARPATPCLTAAAATGRHPANRTSPANSRQSGLRVPLAVSSPRYLALTNIRRRSQSLPAATEDKHRPPSTPNRARTIALPCPYRPFRCCIVIPSVDLGLGSGPNSRADRPTRPLPDMVNLNRSLLGAARSGLLRLWLRSGLRPQPSSDPRAQGKRRQDKQEVRKAGRQWPSLRVRPAR